MFCFCLKFSSVDMVSYSLLEGVFVLFLFSCLNFSSVDTVSYSLLEGGGVLFVFKVPFRC